MQLNAITDFLNEQSWFQQLKGKWEELDPQSRSYLKIATFGSAIILALYLVLSSIWGLHVLKTELAEKNDLLAVIQNANDELRRLKENGGSINAADAGGPWVAYFESVASANGIDKSIMTVSAEKAGTTSDVAKESLFEISVKKASIKQVVKLAYSLENGGRPVKIRNLSIDTEADPEGYMNAMIDVSGFTLNAVK